MKYNILAGEHISKKYGKNSVLKDVSIHVKQGEISGLIGKNGSGKTTLLRILSGLIPNFGGDVIVGERNGGSCKVAAVISSPALFLNMTVIENMREQAVLLGLNNTDKIVQVLETVGMENCCNQLARDLSLGMAQRLKLGMALLENPDILILDEPVNGLDPDGIADLRELLHRLNKEIGMTIIISSHILSELENTATCFGILNNGEITKELSIRDIRQSNSTLESLYMQYTKGGYKNNA